MTATGKPVGKSLETRDDGTPRFRGCSSIQSYEYLGKLGEGTFGEVSKARSKRTGELVALKKILMHHEKDGFPITALREIKLLKQLDHVNVLKLEDMVVERFKDIKKKASMYMITPYMDHDLSGLLENPNVVFSEAHIKCYMKQLLVGTAYLHENKILHRDMKAANLLINNRGILQIADFGLARPFEEDPPKPGQGGGEATRDYTTLVVTRWYRPPELLLQLRRYTSAVDIWGVGCVFGEMFKGKPILAGNSDINQAQLIFDLVGAPTEENMPGWSELPGCEGIKDFAPRPSTLDAAFGGCSAQMRSLLSEMLTLDWRKRINAIDALQHPYFHSAPLPTRPEDLPQFESSHELDRRKFRDLKNKPPPAPAGGSVGVGPQGEWGVNGRPAPQDGRAPSRIPAGGRPYANGFGPPSRRPPAPIPPAIPNGGFQPNNHPQRPYDAPSRRPPYDDRQPYSNRIPHRPPQNDMYADRPPPYPPRLDLHGAVPPPPRGPPLPPDAYRQPSDPPYRDYDRDRDYNPLPGQHRRTYPPSQTVAGPLPGPTFSNRPPGPPEVDTYIPSYQAGDARPRPDMRRDQYRDNDRGRPPPRHLNDNPPMDYGDDRGGYQRDRDRDYPPSQQHPPPRRRSRSPYRGGGEQRDWARDRERPPMANGPRRF